MTTFITANIGNVDVEMDGNGGLPVAVSDTKPSKEIVSGQRPIAPEDDIQHVTNNGHQQKKGHRRKSSKRKRKWKPYSKMSWEERKVLEEKEKSKAVRMREEMKEKGRPVAPYNTTQFLMDEHDPYDGGLEISTYNNSHPSTTGTDEGESYSDDQDDGGGGIEEPMVKYTDSPHMVPEFISQDFSETYERVHEESLNTMSKEDLLLEHMDLEQKFSEIQEQLAKIKRTHSSKINALEARIEELRSEKENLQSKNESLLAKVEALRSEKHQESTLACDAEEVEKIKTLTQGEIMERR